jgi:hypothetical protein
MTRRRRRDDDFDQRLETEIITDAKPDELWIGVVLHRRPPPISVQGPMCN